MKKYFTAICFFPLGDPQKRKPRKYRNINNRTSFEKFAKDAGIAYINYYHKDSKLFSHRVRFIDHNPDPFGRN